jgi:hypothetical protein
LEYTVLKKAKPQKNQGKCIEGNAATGNFEKTMKALFQVPKSVSQKPKKGKG